MSCTQIQIHFKFSVNLKKNLRKIHNKNIHVYVVSYVFKLRIRNQIASLCDFTLCISIKNILLLFLLPLFTFYHFKFHKLTFEI